MPSAPHVTLPLPTSSYPSAQAYAQLAPVTPLQDVVPLLAFVCGMFFSVQCFGTQDPEDQPLLPVERQLRRPPPPVS
eukprot:COSAG06_NODE_63037_length_263_cov_0.871951_1_plen_76_part_01